MADPKKRTKDIDLPNESGESDLYDMPDSRVAKGKAPVRSKGLRGATALEVRDDGSTMRGVPYRMKDGKKKVVRAATRRSR